MKTPPAEKRPGAIPGKSRYLRRKRVLKAVRAVERGEKDTERRGEPNDLPAPRQRNGRRV
jgi:hypothetical protein